jgi:hypothetical protein
VHEVTIWRWQQDPSFPAAVQSAIDDLHMDTQAATRRTRRAALDVLERAMESGSPRQQLRAALAVFRQLGGRGAG